MKPVFSAWGFRFSCRTIYALVLILLAMFLGVFAAIVGLYKLGGAFAVTGALVASSSITIDNTEHALIKDTRIRAWVGNAAVVIGLVAFFLLD